MAIIKMGVATTITSFILASCSILFVRCTGDQAWNDEMLLIHNQFRTGVLDREGNLRDPPVETDLKPLEWNNYLQAFEQSWLDSQVKKHGCPLDHTSFQQRSNIPPDFTGYTGENIYKWGGRTLPSARSIIDSFYNEGRCYRHGRNGWDSATRQCIVCPKTSSKGCSLCKHPGGIIGHFTQVMWANTRQIGCAAAQCDESANGGHKGYLIGCAYYPGGNWAGQEAFSSFTADSLGFTRQPECCEDRQNECIDDSSDEFIE